MMIDASRKGASYSVFRKAIALHADLTDRLRHVHRHSGGSTRHGSRGLGTNHQHLGTGGQMGGVYDMTHYNASKGAVIAFTHSLAIGLGVKGITANTVSPGFIDTPMARRAIETSAFPIDYRDIVARYPIPRFVTAEDIAAACSFFASEDSDYITNQILGVNGGCYN
jgi:NAD(P)-dependent dehydrogenase (short-subunit alcohol dehydrogenase family)